MNLVHLYHSGILFETASVQIFVDAISNINQHINFDKSVYFFVTHSHSDHFDPLIFSYQGKGVNYVLSDDIRSHPDSNYMRVKPDETYKVGDLEVKTFKSTDCGVAFAIAFEGYHVFHSGDLNWWHWHKDSETNQMEEAKQFKAIVDNLPNYIYDVFCIPVDPRLEGAYHLAGDYVLDSLTIKHLVPMHFRKQFDVTDAFYHHRHKDARVMRVSHTDEVILVDI